eukprot:scaffold89974_cov36-Tisochrysis_lutea.AAC.2
MSVGCNICCPRYGWQLYPPSTGIPTNDLTLRACVQHPSLRFTDHEVRRECYQAAPEFGSLGPRMR